MLHTTMQWWSSSPQGLVGVRYLPGPKSAWKNMWVCKEKIHRWLKLKVPFPTPDCEPKVPGTTFHLDLPQAAPANLLLGSGQRGGGHTVPRGSHANWVPWGALRPPGARQCLLGRPELSLALGQSWNCLLSFIKKRNTAAAALASSDWLNEFQGFYCLWLSQTFVSCFM